MKRTRLKPISQRKLHQIETEKPIRVLLEERANGRCEQCGQLPDFRGLCPHERIFRSRGGKLTLWNSVMLCRLCHSRFHGLGEHCS